MLTVTNELSKEDFEAWANQHIRSWTPETRHKPFGERTWLLEVKNKKRWKVTLNGNSADCLVTRESGSNHYTVFMHLNGKEIELQSAIGPNGRASFNPRLLKKYCGDAVLVNSLYQYGWMQPPKVEEVPRVRRR